MSEHRHSAASRSAPQIRAAMRQSAQTEHLPPLLRAHPDLHFRIAGDGTILEWSGGQEQELYAPPEHFLGRRMQDVLPSPVGAIFAAAISQAISAQTNVDAEYSLPVQGREQWYEARLIPLTDCDQVLAIVRNVSEHRRAEEALRESERRAREAAESNQRLLREVDHRVKNNLAGLLALLSLARQKATDVDSLARAMEGRLLAMAHIHQLLGEGGWGKLGIQSLVRSVLSTLSGLARHSVPMSVAGPDVSIESGQAVPLTMILVEWFTNSCKYGAHSVPTGQVRIAWEQEMRAARPWLVMRWQETGGPPIEQPVVPSLGTDLIRSFAARELGGSCLLSFPVDGVDHRLEFPIGIGSAPRP